MNIYQLNLSHEVFPTQFFECVQRTDKDAKAWAKRVAAGFVGTAATLFHGRPSFDGRVIWRRRA